MAPRVRLRIEPYDPDARDADGDGIVQEGTAWERPLGTQLLDDIGNVIKRGLTSDERPSLRIVDSSGRVVNYVPSYGNVRGRVPSKPGQPFASLSERGYRTLGESGYQTIGQMMEARDRPNIPGDIPGAGIPEVGAPNTPGIGTPEIPGSASTVDSPDGTLEAVESLVRKAPANKNFPKRANKERARRRADDKARELSFLEGPHYVIETDSHYLVIDEKQYKSLSDTFGEDKLKEAVKVFRYEKKNPDIIDSEEARSALRGVKALEGEIDAEKYLDGVTSVHYGSGSVDDITDDVFAAVIFDESLTDSRGTPIESDLGEPLTFEDILIGNYEIAKGDPIENRRFSIEALKDAGTGDGLGGIWSVYRVVDKETGDVWFIKSSTYGANDGMLENVGMRTGALLDLPAQPDEKHIKTGASIAVFKEGQRNVRWTAMRHVDSWEGPDGQKLSWKTAADVGGVDASKVNMDDFVQLAIMDYVLDQNDRHQGNFMVAIEPDGTQRIAVIDNGLLFGGRIYDQPNLGHRQEAEATEAAFRTLALEREKQDIDDFYSWGTGNSATLLDSFSQLDLGLRLEDEATSDRFDDTVKETIRRLRDSIDSILNPQYYKDRGIPLSPTEEAHLKAMKQVADARIAKLVKNPDTLRRMFAQQAYNERRRAARAGVRDESVA